MALDERMIFMSRVVNYSEVENRISLTVEEKEDSLDTDLSRLPATEPPID
jgi:hypothetical protein